MADIPTLTIEAAELEALIQEMPVELRQEARAAVVSMAAAVGAMKKLPAAVGTKMWDITVTFMRKAMIGSIPGVRVITKTPEEHFQDIRNGLGPETLAMLDEATGRKPDIEVRL